MPRKTIRKQRLYKVSFWWIIDVEDPEKRDVRDAIEKAWTFIKVKPTGWEGKPYRPRYVAGETKTRPTFSADPEE